MENLSEDQQEAADYLFDLRAGDGGIRADVD